MEKKELEKAENFCFDSSLYESAYIFLLICLFSAAWRLIVLYAMLACYAFNQVTRPK